MMSLKVGFQSMFYFLASTQLFTYLLKHGSHYVGACPEFFVENISVGDVQSYPSEHVCRSFADPLVAGG